MSHCGETSALLEALWTVIMITGLPRSLPNADQCRSMAIKILALIRNSSQLRSLPINADQFLSISLNSDQCRSMPINARSSRIDLALIDIDRHWSTLIDIDRHWSTLIGIDRHWSALICIYINFSWSAMIAIDRHWSPLRDIDRHWLALISIDRHLFMDSFMSTDAKDGLFYWGASSYIVMGQKYKNTLTPCFWLGRYHFLPGGRGACLWGRRRQNFAMCKRGGQDNQ